MGGVLGCWPTTEVRVLCGGDGICGQRREKAETGGAGYGVFFVKRGEFCGRSWLQRRVYWFLERVAVRVAEEKGVAL